MQVKNGACKSFLPRLQPVRLQNVEINHFESCDISEENMTRDDVSHLIINDDEDITDVEA